MISNFARHFRDLKLYSPSLCSKHISFVFNLGNFGRIANPDSKFPKMDDIMRRIAKSNYRQNDRFQQFAKQKTNTKVLCITISTQMTYRDSPISQILFFGNNCQHQAVIVISKYRKLIRNKGQKYHFLYIISITGFTWN